MAAVPNEVGEFQDDTEDSLNPGVALKPDADLNPDKVPADAEALACEKIKEEIKVIQEKLERVKAEVKERRLQRTRSQFQQMQEGAKLRAKKADVKTQLETVMRQLEEQQNLRKTIEGRPLATSQKIPSEKVTNDTLQNTIAREEGIFQIYQNSSQGWDQTIASCQAAIQQAQQIYQSGSQKQQEYQNLLFRYNSIQVNPELRQAVSAMDVITLDNQIGTRR